METMYFYDEIEIGSQIFVKQQELCKTIISNISRTSVRQNNQILNERLLFHESNKYMLRTLVTPAWSKWIVNLKK